MINNGDSLYINPIYCLNDCKYLGLIAPGFFLTILGSLFFKVLLLRGACLFLSAVLILPFIFMKKKESVTTYVNVFFIYLMLCFVSVVYSVDKIQSIGKSGEMLVGFLWVYSAYALNRKNINRLFRVTVFLSVWFLFLSLCLYVFNFDGFFDLYVVNVFNFKAISNPVVGTNGVGLLGVMVGLIFLAKYIEERKYIDLFYSCFFSSFSLLTYSRTSIVALLLGIILLYSVKIRYVVVLISLLGGVLTSFKANTLIDFAYRGQTRGNFLSGREDLWELAWNAFLNKPFLGYGYGVGSEYATRHVVFSTGAAASTAHNGLLEVLLNLGVIGASILVPLFFVLMIRFFNCVKLGRDRIVFSSFPVILGSSVMNTGVAGWFGLPMVFFYLMLFSVNTGDDNESIVST